MNNLGFHIYREENGERVRLTSEPVAGSAFLAGSRTALTAGHHYHWWDVLPSPQSSLNPHHSSLIPVRYWLKDIDLNGTHTMHGPVTPMISREPIPDKLRPELLSEVGLRLQERYHHYWRVQELKEKLNDRSRSRSTTTKDHSRLRSAALEERFALGVFHSRQKPKGNLVPDPRTHQFLAGKPGVKLFVRGEGWYRVSQPELVAGGLSPKANPRYLQLYVEGREQPIRVVGKRDGVFGPGDAIEFYGVGSDTPCTDTRVYWLVEGPRPGKRVEVSHGEGGQIASLSFPYTVEKKDRTIYFAALKNGEESNFFGPLVSEVGVDELLEVRHLDRSSTEGALLEVVLHGVTSGVHQVKVLFNNDEVGEIAFEGQSRGVIQVEVASSLVEERENIVSLVAQNGEMDISVLDVIRLSYWHTYVAEDNALKFTASGGGHLTLSGFSSPKVRVIDITEPNDPMEVIGKVGSEKGGGYAVSFRVPGVGSRRLLALGEEWIRGPLKVSANRPSFWSRSGSGYDLLMISHGDFMEALKPLKQLRESQGLKVALIDIEDLYDEFNFGNKSPKAIKDFLVSARGNWHRPPRFVLLVGDASLDPWDYLGYGDYDFVPTKLVDTQILETASDDWFVDFNNDGLPEIAIGRLPVRTVEEANTVVAKIVGYERSGVKRGVIVVADRVDREGDFDFEGASEEIRALLPSSLKVQKIYRSQFSDEQARSVLISSISQGPLLVNFIGHGSVGVWRGVLSSEDAEGMINGMGLSLFISMTCLNGYFQDIYMESMAESLLKAPGGGAIAVWTSSGMTEPEGQAVMNKELIRLLFNGQSLTLGEATARAKASVSDQDIRKTWILFGDPTTRLK